MEEISRYFEDIDQIVKDECIASTIEPAVFMKLFSLSSVQHCKY